MAPLRFDWLDRLKAIGILLVIAGHTYIWAPIDVYIYSFHMPLFFFIPGYLLDFKKYPAFAGFARRKSETLLAPYFIFSVINYLFWFLLVRRLNLADDALQAYPLRPFLGIFYSVGERGWMLHLWSSMWFLTCLFVAEMISYVTLKKVPRRWWFVPLMLFPIAGYILGRSCSFRWPWSFDVALVASFFYIIGYRFKTRAVLNREFGRRDLYWMALLLPVHLGFAYLNGKVDMNTLVYHNLFYFLCAGITGTIFWVGVSKFMKQSTLITFLGTNTLVFMSFNGAALFVLQGFYHVAFRKFPPLKDVPVYVTLIYVFFQTVILSVCAVAINRWFSWMLGAKKK